MLQLAVARFTGNVSDQKIAWVPAMQKNAASAAANTHDSVRDTSVSASVVEQRSGDDDPDEMPATIESLGYQVIGVLQFDLRRQLHDVSRRGRERERGEEEGGERKKEIPHA